MGSMGREEKAALISTAVTFGLALLKYAAFAVSGSLAILADSVHSLTDTLTSLLVLLGLRISKRKSKDFPYGFYKVENLVALILSLAIFFAGFEILKMSLERGYEVSNIPYAAAVAFLGLLSSYFLSIYKTKVGRETGSPSLIADGLHSRSDALSSAVVLVGVLSSYTSLPFDRISAVVVALFVFRAGWSPLKDSLRVLLDASIEPEVLLRIQRIILAKKSIKRLVKLTGRNSGRFRFIEAVIEVDTDSLREAHRLSEELEKEIKAEIPRVDRILIHYEPVEKRENRVAVPLDEKGAPTLHLGKAVKFRVIDYDLDRIVKDEVVENPHRELEKGRGRKAAEFLKDLSVDVVLFPGEPEEKGAVLILKGEGIRVENIENYYPLPEDLMRG